MIKNQVDGTIKIVGKFSIHFSNWVGAFVLFRLIVKSIISHYTIFGYCTLIATVIWIVFLIRYSWYFLILTDNCLIAERPVRVVGSERDTTVALDEIDYALLKEDKILYFYDEESDEEEYGSINLNPYNQNDIQYLLDMLLEKGIHIKIEENIREFEYTLPEQFVKKEKVKRRRHLLEKEWDKVSIISKKKTGQVIKKNKKNLRKLEL